MTIVAEKSGKEPAPLAVQMGTSVEADLLKETDRLFRKLQHAHFTREQCARVALLTLEINALKKARNAVILAHSYQTPDILFGIADFQGDSYQLSKKAAETTAEMIIFCGVRFMAETAKILNPSKTVILPAVKAGCSLADSITADDVRTLKAQHPGVPVVCYVNTSAEVKAESDACCTSANALKIVEALPGDEVIFIPDEFMAKNLQAKTGKKIISWNGKCIVHKDFKAAKIEQFRKLYPGLKVFAHTECAPEVALSADLACGTGDMIREVTKTDAPAYMLITECSFSDRLRVDFPEKKFLGMCALCPYMKMNTLPVILQTLRDPKPEQFIEIPENIRVGAEKSLKKMFEIGA
ncbi:MAG: quinolinate synthase NadA [Candidatus Gracilibacteria bacterium]|jgi:quinolinate synthase